MTATTRLANWVVAAACGILVSLSAAVASAGEPFPEIRDWNSLTIGLTRSGCFGTCPAYRVEIHGDGRVVFEGGNDVTIPGHHTAHVSPGAVKALFERFRAADFFALRDEYRAPITDFPSYQVSIAFDGHSKKVTDYAGAHAGMPKAVSGLEDEVDRVAGVARWIAGNAETVPALRAEGWDFRAAKNAGLIAAASRSGSAQLVRDLVLAGAPVDGVDPSRYADDLTPLAWAARRGDPALMNFLLAHGADANWRSRSGATVLIAAAHSGRPDVVAAILRHHPKLNVRGNDGDTALTAAADMGAVTSEPAPVDRPAVIRMLVAAGADIRAVNRDGDTVLMQSQSLGGPVVKALVAAGANPNARNHDGETPLSRAYMADGAQALLESGADPWAKLPDGRFAYQATRENDGDVAIVIDKWMASHPRPLGARP